MSTILSNNCNYDNNTIYHNIHSHNDVPIWVIIDYLDFGTLRSFVKDLPLSIQNKIAVDCIDFIQDNIPGFNTAFPPNIMNSFIKNIHETRNICAHNQKLLNFTCRSDISYFEALANYFSLKRQHGSRKSVYSTFTTLACFLSRTEFAILHNTLRKRMDWLDNKLTTISSNAILSSLGFPHDWEKMPAIQQHH